VRLKEALQATENQLSELEQKYEEMKHKLKDMHIRRMELMGRENVTRAHHQMDRVITNSDYSDKSYSRFMEIESYLGRVEEQVNSAYYRNTIDSKIRELEKDMKKQESNSVSS